MARSGDWAQNVAKATKDYSIHERDVTLELEEFVGGVATGRMLRAGGIASYAIYLTSRRLIGAKDRKALWKGIAGSA